MGLELPFCFGIGVGAFVAWGEKAPTSEDWFVRNGRAGDNFVIKKLPLLLEGLDCFRRERIYFIREVNSRILRRAWCRPFCDSRSEMPIVRAIRSWV